MIRHCRDAHLPGAMSTTVESPLRLDAMADDLTPAVVTDRRQLMNGALEAVERMSLAGRDYLE